MIGRGAPQDKRQYNVDGALINSPTDPDEAS